jgi:hypothetical protein
VAQHQAKEAQNATKVATDKAIKAHNAKESELSFATASTPPVHPPPPDKGVLWQGRHEGKAELDGVQEDNSGGFRGPVDPKPQICDHRGCHVHSGIGQEGS